MQPRRRQFSHQALTGLLLLASGSSFAQAAKIGGQVVAIDREKNTVTLKAVMGHRTLRVLRPALLEGLKVGDEILLAVGQDGKEIVVTEIEVLKK